MSDARSLAEPSWQVVGPKRGADKAKVAREVVEWDRTTAALKQWSKEGEIDLCVKAVFDRDWNTGKNQQDTIAQRGAASNRWITSEKQLECRCVENKRQNEHSKTNTLQHATTRCKSVGRESNNIRKRSQRSHMSSNGGAKQAAREV